MDNDEADKQIIRELLQNWVVWRDAGDWVRFKTVWHDDGYMMATWVSGTGERIRSPEPLKGGIAALASCIRSAESPLNWPAIAPFRKRK